MLYDSGPLEFEQFKEVITKPANSDEIPNLYREYLQNFTENQHLFYFRKHRQEEWFG